MRPVRLFLLAQLAVAASGCVGPEYYLTSVSATTAFADEEWNATRAESGIRAAGFEPRRDGTAIFGGNHRASIHVQALPNGTVEWRVSFRLDEAVGEREDAEARGREVQALRAAEAATLLAAFESAAGWKADAPFAWNNHLLHGD